MRKSRVYDFSFEANYSSTICSRLPSIAKSIFFMSSSSDEQRSTMSAKAFDWIAKKNLAKPLIIPRNDVVEPNLKTVSKDRRKYVKYRNRLELSTIFEKSHILQHPVQHEPYCPLFQVEPNFTADDRERLGFHTNRKEINFPKLLRVTGLLNAKDLVDKYFDG